MAFGFSWASPSGLGPVRVMFSWAHIIDFFFVLDSGDVLSLPTLFLILEKALGWNRPNLGQISDELGVEFWDQESSCIGNLAPLQHRFSLHQWHISVWDGMLLPCTLHKIQTGVVLKNTVWCRQGCERWRRHAIRNFAQISSRIYNVRTVGGVSC